MKSSTYSNLVHWTGLAVLGCVAFAGAYWFARVSQTSALKPSPSGVRTKTPAPLSAAKPKEAQLGMVWIQGGEFVMGNSAATVWPDEQPAHRVFVDGFWIDSTEVTNSQFTDFINATGYVTTAEKAPSAEELLANSPPGTPAPPAELLVAGSLVFTPTDHKVPLNDVREVVDLDPRCELATSRRPW